MAINPITSSFVSGAILTAAQMNQLPRGILAFGASAGTLPALSTTETTLVTISFTIPSARSVQIVGNIPLTDNPSTTQAVANFIYQGTTLIQRMYEATSTALQQTNLMGNNKVVFLSAGTYTFTLRATTSAGTNRVNDSATDLLATLYAFDVGPN
jgi:hypothetical protein